MKEKYCNLIETLVKEHPKFSQYESLLGEIVNDVFNRAEIVLYNIKDEEILTNYLNKTISTSLITIPKQHNIAPKRENKINIAELTISKIESDNALTSSQEEQKQDDINDSINTLFENTTINNIGLDTLPETQNYDLIEEKDESNLLEQNDSFLKNQTEQNINVDQTLIDNLINGVSLKNNDNAVLNNIESSLENKSIANEEDFITYEELDQLDIIEDQSYAIKNNNIETCFEKEEKANLTDFDAESFETESELLETEDTLEVEDEIKDVLVEEFNTYEDIAPKYDCFEYEPYSADFDTEDICKKLIFLNKKYASIDILKICELRYYQNLSVLEIADKMNLQYDDVVDALDKITDSVKDLV